MKLSNNAIQEFKEIYLKKFDVELSIEQANEKGLELLNLFKLIYKHIPVERKIPAMNPTLKTTSEL